MINDHRSVSRSFFLASVLLQRPKGDNVLLIVISIEILERFSEWFSFVPLESLKSINNQNKASAWICTSICPKREFGQKAVRFQIPVFYLESYRFLPSTLKGCQHGP